ncbi:MAG: hypothetical protein QM488_00180 [Rhizobiaceae bacterium]
MGMPHPDISEAAAGVTVAPFSDGFDKAMLFEMLKSDVSRFKQSMLLYAFDELPQYNIDKV